MKLTPKEAQYIVHHLCTEPPVGDALDRVLSHDWTFDPRGSNLVSVLRSYHEQSQVLYRTWSDVIRVETCPHPDSPCKEMCTLCASTIASAPYFTAINFTGHRWEICRACASAMGLPGASPSGSPPPQVALGRLRSFPGRSLAALRLMLRRLFR